MLGLNLLTRISISASESVNSRVQSYRGDCGGWGCPCPSTAVPSAAVTSVQLTFITGWESLTRAWTPLPGLPSAGQRLWVAAAPGTPHLPDQCHHVWGPRGRVHHRSCPEHASDFIGGAVGPNLVRPLWETPADKHFSLSACQTAWEIWLEHRTLMQSHCPVPSLLWDIAPCVATVEKTKWN